MLEINPYIPPLVKKKERSFHNIRLYIQEYVIPKIVRFDNWGQVANQIKAEKTHAVWFVTAEAIEHWSLRCKYKNKHTDLEDILQYGARVAWNACHKAPRHMSCHVLSLGGKDVLHKGVLIYKREGDNPYYKMKRKKNIINKNS